MDEIEFNLELLELIKKYSGIELQRGISPQKIVIRIGVDEHPTIEINGTLLPKNLK